MDRRLIWLALGAFAIGAEGFVISTLLPSIAADTGATISQAGYLVVAYALAYAVGAPVLATVTGAGKRRNVLVAAALVFALGAVGAALTTGYLALLVARVLMAAMAGLYAATAQATAGLDVGTGASGTGGVGRRRRHDARGGAGGAARRAGGRGLRLARDVSVHRGARNRGGHRHRLAAAWVAQG